MVEAVRKPVQQVHGTKFLVASDGCELPNGEAHEVHQIHSTETQTSLIEEGKREAEINIPSPPNPQQE
jgi:hypothetical protein